MQEERSPLRRRGLALALVVLASLAAFAAVLAIWVNRQVLDTENWTNASSELLERPVIRDRVAGFLTDQLYENVDIEGQIAAAPPDRADGLAGTVAGALRDEVEDRAREALARDDVQRLWEDANRAAHATLLRVLEGEGEVVSTEGDTVTLDLKALLAEVQQRAGFGERAAAALPEDAAQVEILRSDELESAQRIGNTLQALPVVLVVLSLVLFGAALLVAPGWRRRAVRAYGIGFVAAGAAALAAKSLSGSSGWRSCAPPACWTRRSSVRRRRACSARSRAPRAPAPRSPHRRSRGRPMADGRAAQAVREGHAGVRGEQASQWNPT